MAEMEKGRGDRLGASRMLPIWFFVGAILLLYGSIITAIGIHHVYHPPSRTPLAEIHPDLWWGGIMLVSGAIFLLVGLTERKKSGE